MKIFSFSLLAVFLFTGCVSISTPVMLDKSFPASEKYEILGPIVFIGTSYLVSGIVLLGGVEYFDLLEEARNRYGPVDDVVSVSLDKKTLGLVPIFAVTNFTLRGIAIRYVKEAPVAAE